ncbi:MAG: YkgJ family cysteine cluster protein [Candidatus Gastranaerophilaceae bacterium]
MIEGYEKYLDKIGEHLQKFFAQQKPYIFCKEGCSFCCEFGEYPFSEVEFQYAMKGYDTLSEKEKNIIQKKIEKIKKEKEKTATKEFMHECPFLIDKKCSIYKYRGIICRTHGLLFFTVDKNGESKNKVPKCVHLGLNYSSVYDEAKGIISSELWRKSGIKTEPVAYNIGRKTLLNNNIAKEFGLDFGEEKALIDWF